MVGPMARLALFGKRLTREALNVYQETPLFKGDSNSIWNNAAQAIEIIQAIERAIEIVDEVEALKKEQSAEKKPLEIVAGSATGAVECPRGTLYHYYEIDENGVIRAADMITPSAQNTARIELDIKEVVSQSKEKEMLGPHLETLVRAYDPCNTCATHMVAINWK